MKGNRILLINLLLLVFNLSGQAQCFEEYRINGINKYNEGDYIKAKEFFEKALKCFKVPSGNDIEEWIKKANDQKMKLCFDLNMAWGRSAFSTKNYTGALDYLIKAKECGYEYGNVADSLIKETYKFIPEKIMENDFNSTNYTWYNRNSKEYVTEIKDGKFRIEYKESLGRFFWESIPKIDTGNFIIESTIRCTKYGRNSSYSLIWGAKDNKNYYEFQIYPIAGTNRIVRTENNIDLNIRGLELKVSLMGLNSNTFSIKKVDSLIYLYINGKNEFSFKTDKLVGNYIGFLVRDTTTIEVDNLKVYRPIQSETDEIRKTNFDPIQSIINEIRKKYFKPAIKDVPEIFFEDSFDNNKNSWGLWDTKEYKTTIQAGKYRIEHKEGTGRFFWKPVPEITNNDFVLETKISCTKFNKNSSYSLIWGTADNTNFNEIIFRPISNMFEVSGQENEIPFTYNSGMESDVFNKGIASNTITIVKVDSLIGFYINGKNEYTARFEYLFGDKIGFHMHDTTTIEADYLKVYHPLQTEKEQIREIYFKNINKYDDANSFSEGRALVKKDGKYGFVDINSNVRVPIIYDVASNFSEGRARVQKDAKYGFVNVDGYGFVPIIYDGAGVFSEGRALVNKNDKYGFVDVNGNVKVPIIYDDASNFSEGRASVKKDGKYGFVDVSGNVMVPIIYDNADDFNEGRALVEKRGKVGFVDIRGKVMVPIIYDDADDFSEGRTLVEKRFNYGFVDISGSVVVPIIYDWAFSFSEGRARVQKDGKWGFVDKSGKVVIPIIYDVPNGFSEGRSSVKKDGKYGFVDINGKIVVPIIYDGTGSFSKGFSEDRAIVRVDSKYGFVDNSGGVVIPIIYDDADDFSEGRARVKKDGRYGFVDINGKVVVPFTYDDAGDFSEGRAFVKIDNKWFLIDKSGFIIAN